MLTGSNGQKRPADAIGAAAMVAGIAPGEITEITKAKSGLHSSGKPGVKARAQTLTPEVRTEIANKATAARWE
jgi:hypothetical protein